MSALEVVCPAPPSRPISAQTTLVIVVSQFLIPGPYL
jgi:hypothetical protein